MNHGYNEHEDDEHEGDGPCPSCNYLEFIEDRFPESWDEIMRLALLLKTTLENSAALFELENDEKLACLGIVNHLVKNEHVMGAVNECDTLLGDSGQFLDDEEDDLD